MAESWYLEQEIPTLRRESVNAEKTTAQDVESVWTNFAMRQPGNMRRFRHCRGCIYLRGCGAEMVCAYILAEDKKRPCPFGAGCKVKKMPKGYKLPPEHLAWVRRIDREEAELGPVEAAKRNIRGRLPTWDRDYAKSLYDAGFAVSEIAQIMSVNKSTMVNYAETHGWYTHGRKQFPHADAAALEEERRRFTEWKQKQKQRAMEDAEIG